MSDAAAPMPKPRPLPTPVSQPFWDALRDERVALQRCDACDRWVYYPRVPLSRAACPTGSRGPPSTGVGTVYTFTVAEQPTAPPFADEVPAAAGGGRAHRGRAGVDDPGRRRPGTRSPSGLPVAPVFDHGDDGLTLLRFRPRA